MAKKTMKLIDRLMLSSDKKGILKLLEKVFAIGIPFNKPHKFKFLEISSHQVRMEVPFIRANKNHLGTMHACCQATAGEFAAGMTLLKHFAATKYRVVMKDLKIEFHKQAFTTIEAKSELSDSDVALLKEKLDESESGFIHLETNLYDINQQHIATVETHWQLKLWDKVSTVRN